MDFWELLGTIGERYPDLIPMLQQPGVFKVIADAVQQGWDDAHLESALRQTPYYQTTPKEQRKWDTDRIKDPATAKTRIDQYSQWVDDAILQSGVKLAGKGTQGWDYFATQYFQFINTAIANNWDQQQIKHQLMFAQEGIGGEQATQTSRVMKMADDYGVPLGKQTAMIYGRQLTGGMLDQQAIQGYMIEQAKSMYPGLTALLDRGMTVRQIADPYLQVAQKELNVDPNTISLTDPKWNRAINQVDPKTGMRVSQSLDDWTKTIRTQSEYGYDKTAEAQTRGAQLSTQLSKMMGAM